MHQSFEPIGPLVNVTASISQGHDLTRARDVKRKKRVAVGVHLIVSKRTDLALDVRQLELTHLRGDGQRGRELWVELEQERTRGEWYWR